MVIYLGNILEWVYKPLRNWVDDRPPFKWAATRFPPENSRMSPKDETISKTERDRRSIIIFQGTSKFSTASKNSL